MLASVLYKNREVGSNRTSPEIRFLRASCRSSFISKAGQCNTAIDSNFCCANQPVSAIMRRMQRREFFLSSFAAAGLAGVQNPPAAQRKGKLKQSIMSSVFPAGFTMSFEDRCKLLAQIGFAGVDLPTAQQVPILRDHGLAPTIMTGTGTSFQNGLIRKE